MRWLTQAQAAKRAGVSDRTIRRWVAAGELPGLYGLHSEDEVIKTEKRMRARRGRRKTTQDREGQ